MPDLTSAPVLQTGALLLILCVLIAVAFYLVSSFRDYAAQDTEDAQEALANLQEMHRKGDISDEEFRTIQANTHRQPVREVVIDSAPMGDESPES